MNRHSPDIVLKCVTELSVLKVRDILESLNESGKGSGELYKGNKAEAYPIHFLLDGPPPFHNRDINIVVLVPSIRLCCGLLVFHLVLENKVLTDKEQREGGRDRTGADYGKRNAVPWRVLSFPNERSSGVACRSGHQDHCVDCDAFRMTRC